MAVISFCLDAWWVESSDKYGWGPVAVRPMGAHFKNQPQTRNTTTKKQQCGDISGKNVLMASVHHGYIPGIIAIALGHGLTPRPEA